MDESASLLKSPVSSPPPTTTTNESVALTKLQEHFNEHTYSCCYNVQPLSHAQIVGDREHSGYVAQLWTLIESRWTTENVAPYYGDEQLMNRPVGNIWQDYQFDPPAQTVLPNQKPQQAIRDLKETERQERCIKCECQGTIACQKCSARGHLYCHPCKQRGIRTCCRNPACKRCSGRGSYVCKKCAGHGKFDCPQCLSHGQVQCPRCKGHRFVVLSARLHVKWSTVNSSITHKDDLRSILPNSEISNATGKVTCFLFDNAWSTATHTIEGMLSASPGISREFRDRIDDGYKTSHCDKTGKILRLHCVIQRLKIRELEYKLDDIPDEVFGFCLLGENETDVYENQYPYQVCSLRCQPFCNLL